MKLGYCISKTVFYSKHDISLKFYKVATDRHGVYR